MHIYVIYTTILYITYVVYMMDNVIYNIYIKNHIQKYTILLINLERKLHEFLFLLNKIFVEILMLKWIHMEFWVHLCKIGLCERFVKLVQKYVCIRSEFVFDLFAFWGSACPKLRPFCRHLYCLIATFTHAQDSWMPQSTVNVVYCCLLPDTM